MEIDRKKLGRAIQAIRLQRNMTQAQLAKVAGLSANSLAILERGKRGCSMKTLNEIAKALDIPASFLAVLGTARPSHNDALAKMLEQFQKSINNGHHADVVRNQSSARGGA